MAGPVPPPVVSSAILSTCLGRRSLGRRLIGARNNADSDWCPGQDSKLHAAAAADPENAQTHARACPVALSHEAVIRDGVAVRVEIINFGDQVLVHT